jgi:hypothetical protein
MKGKPSEAIQSTKVKGSSQGTSTHGSTSTHKASGSNDSAAKRGNSVHVARAAYSEQSRRQAPATTDTPQAFEFNVKLGFLRADRKFDWKYSLSALLWFWLLIQGVSLASAVYLRILIK